MEETQSHEFVMVCGLGGEPPFLIVINLICLLMILFVLTKLITSILHTIKNQRNSHGEARALTNSLPINGAFFCFVLGVLGSSIMTTRVFSDAETKGLVDIAQLYGGLKIALNPLIFGTSSALFIMLMYFVFLSICNLLYRKNNSSIDGQP